MTSGLSVQSLRFFDRGPFSLNVTPGEIVGIVGTSGVGKSCLLRSIADLDEHGGEVFLDGEAQSETPAPAWRSRIGYLPAESAWWRDRARDHFTEDDATLLSRLEAVGLSAVELDRDIHQLSTGERQRLAIVRLLLHAPSVLLLDEPTANLDATNRDRAEAMLVAAAKSMRATLWVGHDPERLARFVDRLVTIEPGGIVARVTGASAVPGGN